jgi:hypothetical protein
VSAHRTDALIERLAADAAPVRPLPPPIRRALTTLAGAMALGGVAILLWGDARPLLARSAGREGMMALEMAAAVATAMLAVTGAFFLSIPGGSRRWLLAPLPAFAAWLGLSGLGCYRDFASSGGGGGSGGHGMDCLVFILSAGALVGIPLLWRLGRARPIDPVPVAALGGLGSAALAASVLQFFHPVAVTFLDLAIHFAAVVVLVGAAALAGRRNL